MTSGQMFVPCSCEVLARFVPSICHVRAMFVPCSCQVYILYDIQPSILLNGMQCHDAIGESQ